MFDKICTITMKVISLDECYCDSVGSGYCV
jgi:hypothetical protein